MIKQRCKHGVDGQDCYECFPSRRPEPLRCSSGGEKGSQLFDGFIRLGICVAIGWSLADLFRALWR